MQFLPPSPPLARRSTQTLNTLFILFIQYLQLLILTLCSSLSVSNVILLLMIYGGLILIIFPFLILNFPKQFFEKNLGQHDIALFLARAREELTWHEKRPFLLIYIFHISLKICNYDFNITESNNSVYLLPVLFKFRGNQPNAMSIAMGAIRKFHDFKTQIIV